MRNTISLNLIAIIAIACSILFHVILTQTVVLTLPAQAASPKPMFVFLGSILQNQDFSNLSIPPLSAVEQVGKLDKNLVETRSFPSPWGRATLTKPVQGFDIRKKEKVIIKSTFQEEPIQDSSIEDSTHTLGIDATLPPYQPLKLYTK